MITRSKWPTVNSLPSPSSTESMQFTHGLIGGKDAVGGVVVFLLAQVGHGEVGQQVHKAALGLGDQGVAVSQEEDILYPRAEGAPSPGR